MLSFIKNLFGSKPAETVAEVPYKVEAVVAPVAEVATAPAEAKPTKAPKAKTPVKGKKPTVKKATTRKPRTPKAPK